MLKLISDSSCHELSPTQVIDNTLTYRREEMTD